MTGNLIASTPKISMHPLAFGGIMVYNSFPQIRDMLLRKFGDDYVLLFARPVENVADGQIDWYTPVQGDSQPLFNLPPEEREPICASLNHMAKEISNYADELIDSHDPLKVTRGHILKLALCYPNDNALYVVGKQPVFTCWGFEPGTPGVEAKNLMRLAPPKDAVPKPPKPVQQAPQEISKEVPPVQTVRGRAGWGWLLWLLPLIPLLLIFFLLFTSFGPLEALSGHTLFSWPIFDAPEKKQDIALLESQIATLRSDVEKHAALCVKPVAPKVPQRTVVPGKAPDQTPIILPKTPPQKPEGYLVIPENAHDTSFLEGRWLCETGLANQRTNEPVRVAISFNKDGRGEARIYESNDLCKGAADATMQNRQLHISIDTLICERAGTRYYPVSIICENSAASSTLCRGLNYDGSTWDATFIKINQ